MKQYRQTEKYKQYSNCSIRKQYLKNYIKTENSKQSKKKYMQTENGKQSHKISSKKYCKSQKGKDYRKKYESSKERKEYIKLWNKTPTGLLNQLKKNLKRRAAKYCVLEKYTEAEWQQKLMATNGICHDCNTYVGIEKLERDHIYALILAYKDFLKTGIKRVYYIKDMQPLCKSCNSSKQDKLIIQNFK